MSITKILQINTFKLNQDYHRLASERCCIKDAVWVQKLVGPYANWDSRVSN